MKVTTRHGWTKNKNAEQEQREEAARQRTISQELEWIRAIPRGAKAKQKARITAFEELVAKSSDRQPGTAQIVIPVPERLGGLVIEAEDINKAFGDRLLIEISRSVFLRVVLSGLLGRMAPGRQHYFV